MGWFCLPLFRRRFTVLCVWVSLFRKWFAVARVRPAPFRECKSRFRKCMFALRERKCRLQCMQERLSRIHGRDVGIQVGLAWIHVRLVVHASAAFVNTSWTCVNESSACIRNFGRPDSVNPPPAGVSPGKTEEAGDGTAKGGRLFPQSRFRRPVSRFLLHDSSFLVTCSLWGPMRFSRCPFGLPRRLARRGFRGRGIS